jgi:citrate synthase
MPDSKPGLRDVIAGQTSICWLDEPNQNFYYRGYSIQDLAEHSTFEEVAYLLLYGELPNEKRLEGFTYNLFQRKNEVFSRLANPQTRTRWVEQNGHPMDFLAQLVEEDGLENPLRNNSNSLENDLKLAECLIARMALFCGLTGLGRKVSCVSRSNSSDALRILTPTTPTELEVKMFDLAAILYAEHEFNASTFAVRLAASAHTDMYSAIIGAIGVLKGDRHGGANEQAMKKMLEIGQPEKAKEFLDKFFETPKARLPGFGHAVYTRSDPRVAILRPWVKRLSETKGDLRWYEIALAMEEYMVKRAAEKGGRGVPANADLWTAPLYYLLGIPIELFTPIFAASRIAGWCAHYLEVRHQNKEPILRPRAEYVGPAPQPYIPINQRE